MSFEPQEPLVHQPSAVSPYATLGPGTVVWTFATVCEGVSTGKNCAIGSCVFIGRYSRLGDHVRIQHGAFLPARSQIGNFVFIGPNVTFTDDKRPRVGNPFYQAQPPIIEDDVAIGAGAVILPGVRLGRGCLVGAGAVVTHDVEPHAVIAGNPASVHYRARSA